MIGSFAVRRLVLPGMLLSMLAAAAVPSHAAASSACRATFLASISPALAGATNGVHELRISGTLTDCVGAPASATVSAGNVWTDANGFKWQEPVGSLNGSCINNATSATTIARWANGDVSITNYSSNSLTYGIETHGTNAASVVLTAVDQADGQPATLTVNATRDVGAVMTGLLFAADSDDPAGSGQAAFSACSGAGLTTTPLEGFEAFAG